MNFQSIDTRVKESILNSTNFKFDISDLEDKIKQGGIIADIERKKLKSEKDKNLFISLYNKPAIVAFNTKVISASRNIDELVKTIETNRVNIISRNEETGDFNVHTNEYLLQELNFINKYLGFKISDVDKQDIKSIELAKLKAKGLTRSCGFRYKVRDLLMGIT